jgi:ATP-dependent exoDNAse (exonuclease V) beta subunit
MDVDIRELRNAFKHIKYYDASHVYVDTITGKRLTSVTQLLSRHRPKFEKHSISKAISKRDDRPQSEILAEWNMKSRIGSYRGSLLHDHLENLWKGKVYNTERPEDVKKLLEEYSLRNEFDSSIATLQEMAMNYINDHDHYYPIALELVVGNSDIAGQMDLLVWDDKKKCIVLVDYKTDKKMLDHSEYGKTFLSPLTNLADCEINKYSLQLSLYRKLLEDNTSLKIKRQEIVWFNYKNTNYQVIPVKYMKKNINALLKSFAEKKDK